MKHLSALLFFLLFSAQALTAQVAWLNAADQWTFYGTFGWSGPGIEQVKVEKDTAIGAVAYKKLLRTAQLSSGVYRTGFRLLRQEGKKVFARPEWSASPLGEFLMYDFALKVGDTVRVPLHGSQPLNFGYIITEVTTVALGGQTRVKQGIQWLNSAVQKGTLIEGIGCVEGLHKIGGVDCLTDAYLFLDEPSAAAVDGPARKFCSFQSGAFIFEGLGIALCKTLPVQTPAEAQVSVYPSLSTGTLYFSALDPSADYQVTLYDLAGKQFAQTTLSGDGSITTEYKGMAIVALQTSAGKSVKRVVFF